MTKVFRQRSIRENNFSDAPLKSIKNIWVTGSHSCWTIKTLQPDAALALNLTFQC